MSAIQAFLAVDFGLNALGWAISASLQTDHFYDLTGSFAFIGSTLASVYARGGWTAITPREQIGAGAMLLWAFRLGAFLFTRALAWGDRRLEKMKRRPRAFAIAFTAQSVWVLADSLPLLLLLQAGGGKAAGAAIGPVDVCIAAAWAAGFLLQVVADAQRRAFKADPANAGKWQATGLFARAQHPNYLGQMVVTGSLALWCARGLLPAGGAALSAGSVALVAAALLAPALEALLLLRVSGVPLLRREAEQRWGADPAFRRYVQTTPLLLPRLWGSAPAAKAE